MITDVIKNATVKAAIEALQKGDRKAWSALFEPDAKLYDDGSPRPLQKFTDDALGHERFTSIERVENDGLDVTGAFHSDKWGRLPNLFQVSAFSERQDQTPRHRPGQITQMTRKTARGSLN